MCDNGNYFFYFTRLINYNIFELHFTSKRAKVTKKEQTNAVKQDAKT